MRLFRSSKGFTLIELVMVIAILGILAAVAVPKMYNIKSQAQIAAVAGYVGSIGSGVNGFALIAQVDSTQLPLNAKRTSLGYPIDLDDQDAAAITLLFQYVLQQPVDKDWKKTGPKLTTEGLTESKYQYLLKDTTISYINKTGYVGK